MVTAFLKFTPGNSESGLALEGIRWNRIQFKKRIAWVVKRGLELNIYPDPPRLCDHARL